MNWLKNIFKKKDPFEKQKEDNILSWKNENKLYYDFNKYNSDQISDIMKNTDPDIKWHNEDFTSLLYGWSQYGIILSLNGEEGEMESIWNNMYLYFGKKGKIKSIIK